MSDDTREFLNPELSLLAFQRRVLALAEDPRTPLLERLRFLGIVTSNIDELYMVRMAELREAAVENPDAAPAGDGYSAAALLAAVDEELAQILSGQSACAAQCLRDAEQHGVRVLTWAELSDAERDALHQRYLEEIQPDLVPMALTRSAGVPLPHLPHLGLFVAIVYRAPGGTRTHLAEHELPSDVPRLLPVPGRVGTVLPLEELLRANVQSLYPNAHVEAAYLFRVTRGGDLRLNDDAATDLLGAVAAATARRPHNPAVRVEVEAQMPPEVRALIIDNLHRDALGRELPITVDAAQVVDGMLDLRCLQALPLPGDPSLVYPPLVTHTPEWGVRPMFDAIRDGERLVHHPFQSFDDTVVRFFREAAADPEVTSISATLYRVGNPSPIVDALLTAARTGKRVFALVELQARFDEEHNVQWARALERAGGRVVYGLPGLKVHAKVALVERRTAAGVERFAHVGTGNYNPRSGRQYTDLSLFSASEAMTTDVAELLEALAASTYPEHGLHRGALVAPSQLLPSLFALIERETEHARMGRPAKITVKANGLADREVVRALYRAAQAGVQIDLVIRGICTLRPGMPGISDTVRVVSVVGRFLEHSRIYRFANAGEAEYFIGSADLRPRNLRRRVELLVPVTMTEHRAQLDDILERYLGDSSGWVLQSTGAYVPGRVTGASAQVSLATDFRSP